LQGVSPWPTFKSSSATRTWPAVKLEFVNGREGKVAKAVLTAISNSRRGSGEEPRGSHRDPVDAVGQAGRTRRRVPGQGLARQHRRPGAQQQLPGQRRGEVYGLAFTVDEIDYLDSKAEGEARRAREVQVIPRQPAPSAPNSSRKARSERQPDTPDTPPGGSAARFPHPIFIHRTRSITMISPPIPPLATRFGQNTFVIRSETPLAEDQMRRAAPSIFAEGKHGSRSERYTYIPTIDVLRGLRQEGFEPFMVAQSKSRIEGKTEFTKHMIRMRHAGQVNTRPEANEIILINSHDGASSYQMLAGVFRFVCCNGLVVGDVTNDIRIPHKGNIQDEVIEGAFRVLEDFEVVDASTDRHEGPAAAARGTAGLCHRRPGAALR
jgi:hypothetical protein